MRTAVVLGEYDLNEWRASHTKGLRPSQLLYGIDALERCGVRLVGPKQTRSRVGMKLRDVVEHRSGLKLERPLRAIPKVRSADVVIASLEAEAAVPARLRALNLPPYSSTPLLTFMCWVAKETRCADSAKRKRILESVTPSSLYLYWSHSQTPILADLGLDPDRLAPVPFGVDADFFSPSLIEQDLEVVAVGQDRGRDYETLFEAVRGTDLRVTLICKRTNIAKLEISPNVTMIEPVDYGHLSPVPPGGESWGRADPTGQTVALEASACGRAVVVTGTQASREYFTDGDNALLTPVADALGLRERLEQALSDDALRTRIGETARNVVLANYATDHMWEEVIRAAVRVGVPLVDD